MCGTLMDVRMPKADVSMMKIQIENLITYSGKPALIPTATVILRAEMEELYYLAQ